MGLTRNAIARQLAAILELPYDTNKGKACEIVNAVIRSMTNALLRGESIRIDGLGIFRIRERPATRHGFHYFPYLLTSKEHVAVKSFPAKKYVHFQPAQSIVRILNGR